MENKLKRRGEYEIVEVKNFAETYNYVGGSDRDFTVDELKFLLGDKASEVPLK